MKMKCDPTREDQLQNLQQWHWHFAWLPVRVGKHEKRWLEYVLRRSRRDWIWGWDYRVVEKGDRTLYPYLRTTYSKHRLMRPI